MLYNLGFSGANFCANRVEDGDVLADDLRDIFLQQCAIATTDYGTFGGK